MGTVRTATVKCKSHKSNSTPKVNNVPSDSMASFALAMNFKNESHGPCHSHHNSFLGKKLVQCDTCDIKHHFIQHKGTDLIVPLHDAMIGLYYQNLKNHIHSDLLYLHPRHLISSI